MMLRTLWSGLLTAVLAAGSGEILAEPAYGQSLRMSVVAKNVAGQTLEIKADCPNGCNLGGVSCTGTVQFKTPFAKTQHAVTCCASGVGRNGPSIRFFSGQTGCSEETDRAELEVGGALDVQVTRLPDGPVFDSKLGSIKAKIENEPAGN